MVFTKGVTKVEDLSTEIRIRQEPFYFENSEDFESSLAFSYPPKWKETNPYICLIEQNIASYDPTEYKRRLVWYVFKSREENITFGNYVNSIDTRKQYPIVGIFTSKSNDSKDGQYSMFYAINKTIQYCYSDGKRFHKEVNH